MSLFDLSDVVNDLSTGTYTVTRTVPGAYGADGRFIPGAPTTLTIQASVQPLSGRDLLRLPEGLRTRELRKVYTATQLFVQGSGQDPDQISIEGLPFQCQSVEEWGTDGLYWKAIVAKVGRAST